METQRVYERRFTVAGVPHRALMVLAGERRAYSFDNGRTWYGRVRDAVVAAQATGRLRRHGPVTP